MKEDPLRLFIGIDLPAETKERLASIEEELKKFTPNARWVRKENLHLTLKFLGYCDSNRLGEIDQKIKEVAEDKRGFNFILSRLGAFPTLKRARVLWVGVGEGAPQVANLAEDIETSLGQLGFKRERSLFHPHITIARLKIPSSIDETYLTDLAELVPKNQLKAQSIVLFRSKLTPSGAEYLVLKENFLKNA